MKRPNLKEREGDRAGGKERERERERVLPTVVTIDTANKRAWSNVHSSSKDS